MKLKHVEKGITNYIDSDSPYSLLIDGKWGTGKTHYILNEIFPKIKDKNDVFPMYTSLYGCNSLLEIKKKINIAILKDRGFRKKIPKFDFGMDMGRKISGIFGNSIWGKGGTFFFEEFMTYVDDNQLRNMKEKIVLFIDDLERISKDIDLADCLGVINSEYLEKMNIKIIFIANTETFSPKDKEVFRKIREKIIDKIILFNPSVEFTLNEILKDNDNEFLSKHNEWILEVFISLYDSINIRTLNSIISNYLYFENFIISSIDVDTHHLDKLKKSFFLNIMVLTNEYKEKNQLAKLHLDSETVKDLVFDSKYVSSINDITTTDLLKGNIENNSKRKNTYSSVINDKYHGKSKEFDTNVFYFEGVQTYVINGFYNDDLFVKSYDKWKDMFYPTDEFYYYERLYDFRNMNDKELLYGQEKTIEGVCNPEYTTSKLIKMYTLFLQFKEMELYLIDDSKINIIEKEIYNSFLSQGLEGLEGLESVSSYMYMVRDYGFKETNILENNLERLHKELNSNNMKLLIKSILANDLVKTGDLSKQIETSELLSFVDNEIIDDYLLIDENKSDRLMSYIRGQYFGNKNVSNEITRIINRLEEYKDMDLGKVDKFKIKQLMEELEKHK